MRIATQGLRWANARTSVCPSCRNRIQSRYFASTAARSKSSPARPTKTYLPAPGEKVRTRFAPSPTGHLHLGSLRTALFNFLLAKRCGGQFLLRIEDTDQKRTIRGSEERLLEELRWLGLQWDEGPEVDGPYGPYRQSDRLDHYTKHVQQLLDTGKAYRCFCSAKKSHELAKGRYELGLSQKYDRTCAHIPKEQSDDRAHNGEIHVVRLLVDDKPPAFEDLIFGKIGKGTVQDRHGADGYDDPILMKSDGWPTYHLANVVDDHMMDISHVIRGVEWIPSTSTHLQLYRAFEWSPPKFAHVPLLVGEGGQKLSKRLGSTDVESYRAGGFLPEALVNFVALLGWSHKAKSDVFSRADLLRTFDLKITKGNTMVNLGKLDFFQSKHALRRVQEGGPLLDELIEELVGAIEATHDPAKNDLLRDKDLQSFARTWLEADVKNFKVAKEFVQAAPYLFTSIDKIMGDLKSSSSGSDVIKLVDNKPSFVVDTPPTLAQAELDMLAHLKGRIVCISEQEWSVHTLRDTLTDALKSDQKTLQHACWSHLRTAICFGSPGTSVVAAMGLLGREECLKRLDRLWPFNASSPPQA